MATTSSNIADLTKVKVNIDYQRSNRFQMM